MGDGLPVEEVGSRLGLETHSFGRKGEPLHDHPRSATYHTNIRVSEYPVNSDVPFEEQITGLLDALEPRLDALKDILSLPGIKGELFLGFGSGDGQGGAIFSTESLRRVAVYGLSLSLDLYPPGRDEKEAG